MLKTLLNLLYVMSNRTLVYTKKKWQGMGATVGFILFGVSKLEGPILLRNRILGY